MVWIAHYDQDGNAQSVREHSEQTARLSAESAIETLRDICYLIGLLHDVGKYSPMFQRRLTDKSVTYEHSLAGAKAVDALDHAQVPDLVRHLMQLCIIGHHTGIPDCGLRSDNETSPTLRGRLKRPAGDYAAYKTDLTIPDYAFPDFKNYVREGCATPRRNVGKICLSGAILLFLPDRRGFHRYGDRIGRTRAARHDFGFRRMQR